MWMIDPTLGSFLINSTILSVFMACACLKRSNFLKIKKSTTVIHVMNDHQPVTGWMKQALAVSPYRCLHWGMHGWIFGTFHMNKRSAEFVNAAGEYVDFVACSYNTNRKLHALATKIAWTKISYQKKIGLTRVAMKTAEGSVKSRFFLMFNPISGANTIDGVTSM